MQPTGTGTTATPVNGAPPPEKAAEFDSKAEFEKLSAKIEEQNRTIARQQGFIDSFQTRREEPVEEETVETAEADPYENETPDALMEAIGRDGRAALAKRGFIHKSELAKMVEPLVEKMTTAKVAQYGETMNQDAQFARQFPELLDQHSDLYKQTAQLWQEMVSQDPSLKNKPQQVRVAALAAREILKTREASATTPANKEKERREKVAAQSGDRGRPAVDSDESDELTPNQIMIAEKMGITPEQYKKRAEKGVTMSNRSGRGK